MKNGSKLSYLYVFLKLNQKILSFFLCEKLQRQDNVNEHISCYLFSNNSLLINLQLTSIILAPVKKDIIPLFQKSNQLVYYNYLFLNKK